MIDYRSKNVSCKAVYLYNIIVKSHFTQISQELFATPENLSNKICFYLQIISVDIKKKGLAQGAKKNFQYYIITLYWAIVCY